MALLEGGKLLILFRPKGISNRFHFWALQNSQHCLMSIFVHKYQIDSKVCNASKTKLVFTPWLPLFWWRFWWFSWDMNGSSEMFCKAAWMNVWFFIFGGGCFIKVWKANEIRFQKRFIHFLPSYKNFHVRPLHVKKLVSLWISDFEWLPLYKARGLQNIDWITTPFHRKLVRVAFIM